MKSKATCHLLVVIIIVMVVQDMLAEGSYIREYYQPEVSAIMAKPIAANSFAYGGLMRNQISADPKLSGAPASCSATTNLSFEVASIRPSKIPSGPFSIGIFSPAHSSKFSMTNMTIRNLILFAYGISDSQVSGGPIWLNSKRFDIEAKSDGSVDEELKNLGAPEAEARKVLMIRALLADRLGFACHYANAEAKTYRLVVSGHGPNVRTMTNDDTGVVARNSEQAQAVTGRPADDISISSSSIVTRMAAHQTTMDALAQQLGGLLGSQVANDTGLIGRYSFTLSWSSAAAPGSSPWLPLPEALQDQLGLRLEVVKSRVSTIIVDHVELPSEN